jgi:hypothetical protein
MLEDLIEGDLLKSNLKQILINEDLTVQRALLTSVISELNVNTLDCASALLHLLQNGKSITQIAQIIDNPVFPFTIQSNIKMVRYRLAVGSKHQIDLESLKRVLIEESGVDKNNINNVNIQNEYTLVDLPDEMPLDIFQHLKTVEINHHKLDIRRVKTRSNKKRGINHHRHARQAAKNSSQFMIS